MSGRSPSRVLVKGRNVLAIALHRSALAGPLERNGWSHVGFVNKGLPPLAFLQLYEATPGDHLQKLIKLGLMRLDQEWSVRLMGSTAELKDDLGEVVSSDGPNDRPERREVPFAFVMERTPKGAFAPDLRQPPDVGTQEISRPAPKVALAK